MKLKLVVVDLQLSKRQRQILAALVGTSILGAAAVAYAGGIHTWKTGDALSADDLNNNFATLKTQVDALSAGLAQGCTGASALRSIDAQGNVKCAPANDLVEIEATVSGASGGSVSKDCPAGYKLLTVALCEDYRTQSGTNGWTLGGTPSCGISGNTMSAGLSNYAGGSAQTAVACCGVCVRQ
jgi:hypothetical protein